MRDLTYDGAPKAASYASTGPGQTVFKVTKLTETTATASGKEVCFTLSGACPTLASFCAGSDGSCKIAPMDKGACMVLVVHV